MRTSIAEMRNNTADIINRVAYGGERVILERRGKPVAVIIPVEEYEFLERIIAEREDAMDLAAIKASRRERGKSVPLEQVKRELGIGSPARVKGRKRTA